MVLLITAHNTFSGMEHNLPVARWTRRVASGHVRVSACACVCVCVCLFVCLSTSSSSKCARTPSVNLHVVACMLAPMLVCGYPCTHVCMYDFAGAFDFVCVCVCLCICEGPVVRWGGWASRQASPASGRLTGGVQGHSPGPHDVWMDELMESNGVTLSI